MTGFDIGTRHVGDGSPCFIIAEVAQAHEGSLLTAHSFIDAIAKTGADAVKFQCHLAEAESTPDEQWRVKPDWPQDKSRYDYWKRMEFTPQQWEGLWVHAQASGLEFLASPFSVEAVKLLDPFVLAWKIPSGEITNVRLLDAVTDTKKPLILSTGLVPQQEWSRVAHATAKWTKVGLLHCRSYYPTPANRVDLRAYRKMREHMVPVGLSDHSGNIFAGLAAVALGCDILEVHVKLSEYDQGPDASSSITIEQLAQLVEGVRFIEKAKQPVDKDLMAKELEPMRELFLRKHERKLMAQ